MAAKPDLWMPLYFGAYLTDTMHLTTEQHGAYLLLLMACWKRGGVLPDDDEQLSAITKMSPAKWVKARHVISPFWKIIGGTWTQKRLGIELESARQRHQVALENGTKGGRPRKADDNPNDNPDETKQITEQEPKPNPDESSVPRPLPISLPEPSSKPKREARATRLPADITLSDDWKIYCTTKRPELDPDEVFENFKDYWIAEPGKHGTKLDWYRTWKRWVRDQREKTGANRISGSPPWWASNEGIQAKANELGVGSRSGESWNDLKARVSAAIGGQS